MRLVLSNSLTLGVIKILFYIFLMCHTVCGELSNSTFGQLAALVLIMCLEHHIISILKSWCCQMLTHGEIFQQGTLIIRSVHAESDV